MMNSGTTIFIASCHLGDFEKCKYLWRERHIYEINLNAWGDLAFREACYSDNFNIVKWLLSIPNNNICISVENSEQLREMYHRNYSNITKSWLRVSHKPHKNTSNHKVLHMSLTEQILHYGADFNTVTNSVLKSTLRAEMRNIILRYIPSLLPDLTVIITSYL